MNVLKLSHLLVVVGLCTGTALAALPPPGQPSFDRAQMEAEVAAFNKKPDQAGTGRFPALKELDASLPNHVIYRPSDLTKPGSLKLGVVAWGNGGCAADGAGSRFHLAEIASHGYLVIANGRILSGPGAPPPAVPAGPPPGPGELPPAQTRASDLTQAIDWALKENTRQGSPYFGRIDPTKIAVSGWSCGGVQAIAVGADPRVRTVIVHNSGLFERGKSAMAEMDIGKEALQKLHTPVIYIVGGPADIAYPQAIDDFARLRVPVFVASTNVGHGGTFMKDHGGIAASVAVSWLDWQLRGDQQAARRFVGKDCGLCKDPAWDVDSRNFGELK